MQASASGRSADAIDAAFESGKQKIQARLDRDIRQLQAAAARQHVKLQELCADTKDREGQAVSAVLKCALAQKDARALCQLLQAEEGAPVFDVDVSTTGIIVCHSIRALFFPHDMRCAGTPPPPSVV